MCSSRDSRQFIYILSFMLQQQKNFVYHLNYVQSQTAAKTEINNTTVKHLTCSLRIKKSN